MTPPETPEQAFARMLAEDIRKERRLFWGELLVLALLVGFVALRAWYLGR